jgi:hypothetical protein
MTAHVTARKIRITGSLPCWRCFFCPGMLDSLGREQLRLLCRGFANSRWSGRDPSPPFLAATAPDQAAAALRRSSRPHGAVRRPITAALFKECCIPTGPRAVNLGLWLCMQSAANPSPVRLPCFLGKNRDSMPFMPARAAAEPKRVRFRNRLAPNSLRSRTGNRGHGSGKMPLLTAELAPGVGVPHCRRLTPSDRGQPRQKSATETVRA